MDVDDEGVFVLAAGGAGEEVPWLDDKLGDVFQTLKAFLDGLLSLCDWHQLAAVSHTAQETPGGEKDSLKIFLIYSLSARAAIAVGNIFCSDYGTQINV